MLRLYNINRSYKSRMILMPDTLSHKSHILICLSSQKFGVSEVRYMYHNTNFSATDTDF